MKLPTMSLPITVDDFHTHFKYFIIDFEGENDCSIKCNRFSSGPSRLRYELSLSDSEISGSSGEGKIFGEMEAFPITEAETEVRVIYIEIQQKQLVFDFFEALYDTISKKWRHDPSRYPPYRELFQPNSHYFNGYVESTIKSLLYTCELIDDEGNLISDYSTPMDDPRMEKRRLNFLRRLHERLPQYNGAEHQTARPSSLPKRRETLDNWKRMYSIVVRLRKEYQEDFEEGNTDDPRPRFDDYRDAIADEMKEKPSGRKVRYVVKAGDDGFLSE